MDNLIKYGERILDNSMKIGVTGLVDSLSAEI